MTPPLFYFLLGALSADSHHEWTLADTDHRLLLLLLRRHNCLNIGLITDTLFCAALQQQQQQLH